MKVDGDRVLKQALKTKTDHRIGLYDSSNPFLASFEAIQLVYVMNFQREPSPFTIIEWKQLGHSCPFRVAMIKLFFIIIFGQMIRS